MIEYHIQVINLFCFTTFELFYLLCLLIFSEGINLNLLFKADFLIEWQISRYFSDPQYYFQVNDQYVRNKLKVVLFPFLHRVSTNPLVIISAVPSFGFYCLFYYCNTCLALCLFLIQGQWTRITEPVGGRLSYKPPFYDINAPDLYIPLMSFGTYVILAGLSLGLRGK